MRVRVVAPVGSGAGDGGGAVHQTGGEAHVGILEHALLQGDHQELRLREVLPDHSSHILGVAAVQGGINLRKKKKKKIFNLSHV